MLRDPFLIVCFAVALFFLAIFLKEFVEEDPTSILQAAQVHYELGETAENATVRTGEFNASLELFLKLEEQYSPKFGNGKLDFAIGNAFFQLQQYPLALLYYERAASLRPRDEKVYRNRSTTRRELKVDSDEKETPLEKLFFFHNYLSMPERLQLFFTLSFLVLLFASLYFWIKSLWLKYIAIFIACCSIATLLSLSYSHYISPIEGILIESSILYRDAGRQYATVGSEPVVAGSKVTLLDIKLAGKWVQVKTQAGNVGFVPMEKMRII